MEVASFTYHMDGQIATAKANGRQENFLWDNLALISRNETEYVNEPYVTGGNPILADGDLLFNDLLGSTIGIRSGKEYRETGMTAFGETDEKSAMFTGKPYIGELGYAFLFRNYRPGLGKWQTSDPLGSPDGWNNFAYCNNWVTENIDFLGAWTASGHRQFFANYEFFSMYQGMSLNTKYLNMLIHSNTAVNNDQSESGAYKHFMKTRDQSVANAISATNNFINANLIAAHQAVIDYEKGEMSLVAACNQLITSLGIASHTVQDRMCPEHFLNGQPKTWYSGWYSYLNVQHFPELFRTHSTSNMNSFNSWIKSEMAAIIGNNTNIIRELFE